ncbi:hypothetical protein DZA28_14015 [Pseudomonas alloputida]|uniref:HPP family protein n=1 Tax=Pseudomonas alloputida TaxID=1940621 RepID=A0ABY3D5S9_9PSED|nr:hypothetical protein [Pseudomonas alloputida]TRZ60990.1 hypothetical protein DZA28_14015 [Pseudomonas alloputida]
MTKRHMINASLWTGAVVGIYVLLYLISPLAALGTLPCTFVVLPIFLSSNASAQRMPDALTSVAVGVAWGGVFVYAGAQLTRTGIEPANATALSVALLTSILCGAHLLLTPKGLLSHIPLMFGAVACVFFIGVERWPAILLTVCLGVLLGGVINASAKLMDERGRWSLARLKARRQ